METPEFDEYYYEFYKSIIYSESYQKVMKEIENDESLNLTVFEYQTFGEDQWSKLFLILFEICKTDEQKYQLYEYWCKVDECATTPFFLHLFFDQRENCEQLKEVVRFYSIDYKELYFDLMNSTNNDFDEFILEKMDKVFGEQDIKFWELIQSMIVTDDRDGNYKYYLSPFINAKVGRVCKPHWLMDFGVFEPENKVVFRYILDGMFKRLPTSRKIHNMMKKIKDEDLFNYRMMTIAQKADYITEDELDIDLSFIDKEFILYTIEIFRIKGPCNQDDKGNNYFMFDNKFSGKCCRCNILIDNKRYALWEPFLDGGWGSCYCGFECLEYSPTMQRYPKVFENLKYQIETIKLQQ